MCLPPISGAVHRLVYADPAARTSVIRSSPELRPLSEVGLSVKAASASRTPGTPLDQSEYCQHSGERGKEPPTATGVTAVPIRGIHSSDGHHYNHPYHDHAPAQIGTTDDVLPDRYASATHRCRDVIHDVIA
jgi:hypothetical protein